MRINMRSMEKSLAAAGYYLFLFFCLFHLYELLWAHTEYPFTLEILMLAGLCFGLARLSMLLFGSKPLRGGEWMVLFLFAFMGFSILLQGQLLPSSIDEEGINSRVYTINLAVTSAIFMLSGAAIGAHKPIHSNMKAILLMAAITLIIVNAIGTSGNLVVDYSSILASGDLESLSHLRVAEFVVLLIFVAYASLKKYKFTVLIVGALLLFALTGRGSFYFTILTILLFELVRGGRKNLIIYAAIFLGGIFLVDYGLNSGFLDAEQNEIADILFVEGVEEDDSYLARQEIMQVAFPQLAEQFAFGNPALIVDSFDYIGSYIHNLFSAWQFFGFPTFALLVIILGACLVNMWKQLAVSGRDADPTLVFGSLLLIYTILSVLSAKFVGFRLLWMSIGFWMIGFASVYPYFTSRRSTGSRGRSQRGSKKSRKSTRVKGGWRLT